MQGRAAAGAAVDAATRAEAERSPFIDLAHPLTLAEAAKLVVMLPVVVVKVCRYDCCRDERETGNPAHRPRPPPTPAPN